MSIRSCQHVGLSWLVSVPALVGQDEGEIIIKAITEKNSSWGWCTCVYLQWNLADLNLWYADTTRYDPHTLPLSHPPTITPSPSHYHTLPLSHPLLHSPTVADIKCPFTNCVTWRALVLDARNLLYLSLVQVVFYIIVVINHDSKYWLQHSSVACVLKKYLFFRYGADVLCFKIRYF